MSMSVQRRRHRTRTCRALGARGLFACRQSLRPRYSCMLAETSASTALRLACCVRSTETTRVRQTETLEAFLSRHYLRSISSITSSHPWSPPCGPAAGPTPCAIRLGICLPVFLDHHGMLSVFGSLTWRTVTGEVPPTTCRRSQLSGRGVDPHASAPRCAGCRRGIAARVMGRRGVSMRPPPRSIRPGALRSSL